MEDDTLEKIQEERAKLESARESIYMGLRIFREIDETIQTFRKNGNSFEECAGCGRLHRKKI